MLHLAYIAHDTRQYNLQQPYGMSRVMARQEAVPASSDEGENSDVTCTGRRG